MDVITDFNVLYESAMERTDDMISADALVGKEAIETVDYLNKFDDSPLTDLNTFLNGNGFINTFFMAITNTMDEISYIKILAIRSGVPMVHEQFKEFVNTGCMRGYVVKLTRRLSGDINQVLYLQNYEAENGGIIFLPSSEHSYLFSTIEEAKQALTLYPVDPRYKVSFIQVHDDPFSDREIEF